MKDKNLLTRDDLIKIVNAIPATDTVREYFCTAIVSLLDKRLEHFDDDYENDVHRIAEFAEKQHQGIKLLNRAAAKIWRDGEKAFQAIKKELEELVDLYVDDTPPEETGNVQFFKGNEDCGGGRVIRGTRSLGG